MTINRMTIIRKADSKGRLIGFQPGGRYSVESGSDEIFVVQRDPEEVTRFLPQPVSSKGLEYLVEHGIDPSTVLSEGHNSRGVWCWQSNFDGKGVRLYKSGQLMRTWLDWPAGFDYETFVKLARS
jgi:hypothetical protein